MYSLTPERWARSVARTLADLDGAETVGRLHAAEALSYRVLADEVRRAARGHKSRCANLLDPSGCDCNLLNCLQSEPSDVSVTSCARANDLP
jgi:hypothetical protein